MQETEKSVEEELGEGRDGLSRHRADIGGNKSPACDSMCGDRCAWLDGADVWDEADDEEEEEGEEEEDDDDDDDDEYEGINEEDEDEGDDEEEDGKMGSGLGILSRMLVMSLYTTRIGLLREMAEEKSGGKAASLRATRDATAEATFCSWSSARARRSATKP